MHISFANRNSSNDGDGQPYTRLRFIKPKKSTEISKAVKQFDENQKMQKLFN